MADQGNDAGPARQRARRGPSRRAVLLGGAGLVAAGALAAGGVEAGIALRGQGTAGAATTPTPSRPSGLLVRELLATPAFTVAHHGGSRDWPEETMYAYRNAVAAGVDALEVSVARTRDGVWFGLHDPTFERTSGLAASASHLDWSEVSRLRVKPVGAADPGQHTRRYARLETILDAFAATHTLFVDPKGVESAFFSDLLDLLEARLTDPPASVIAKAYCTSLIWARAARSRGYERWGFYYADEIAARPALVTDTQDSWSLLGLDYGGDPGQWTVLKALGKPLIAHVVPDIAAARTGLARGAAGLMISGITETLPGLGRAD